MNKKICIILVALMSLFLIACGNRDSIVVKVDGKNVNLTADLPETIASLSEMSLVPYDCNKLEVYSEDGMSYKSSLLSNTASVLFGTEKLVGAYGGATYESDDPDLLSSAVYMFNAKYIEDVVFPNDVSFSDSFEDVLSKGYTDVGGYAACLIVNGKKVSLDKYMDRAERFLSDYPLFSRSDFLENEGLIKDGDDTDEYLRCLSGGKVAELATYSFENIISAVTDVFSDRNSIGEDPEMLNAYALYFATIDAGIKYRQGKVKSYAVVYFKDGSNAIGNSEVSVYVAADNSAIHEFKNLLRGE